MDKGGKGCPGPTWGFTTEYSQEYKITAEMIQRNFTTKMYPK